MRGFESALVIPAIGLAIVALVIVAWAVLTAITFLLENPLLIAGIALMVGMVIYLWRK